MQLLEEIQAALNKYKEKHGNYKDIVILLGMGEYDAISKHFNGVPITSLFSYYVKKVWIPGVMITRMPGVEE